MPMSLKSDFGKRLQKIRKYRGLTQARLAEAVDLSIEMISNMERGINGPSFATLEKLTKVLNVTAHELFLFDED